MRTAVAMLLGIVCVFQAGAAPQAKDPPKRYGIEADLDNYPQEMPKTAFESVLKAIDNKKIDYLLAQLTDPAWVDKWVQQVHRGKFEAMVRETTELLSKDPTVIKELHRFLREGEWTEDGGRATVSLKDVKDRRVFLRKVEARWYLENDNKDKDKPK